MVLPVLHASGFSWDEAIVLVVAILAVPALSWFTGRFGKRIRETSPSRDERRARRRRDVPETSGEETAEQ